MIINITGDERDVANSAWVSTLNSSKVETKSQEDVERVVAFLVKHHHTSPFESVTITFQNDKDDDDFFTMKRYAKNPFAKSSPFAESPFALTIDLLNFMKITQENNLWTCQLWKLFERERPALARLVREFGPIPDEVSEDISSDLGNHGMKVELVHLHDKDSKTHSRATWRVRCPLSIAVQILRHRSGSYNMVSGRYRTIVQELTPMADDFVEINRKAGTDFDSLFIISTNMIIDRYLEEMKKLRQAKVDGLITNDEYKRARECARFILPEGRMTELYVTYYLSDFYGSYKKLRDSSHAQTEHIWIAQEMARAIDIARK